MNNIYHDVWIKGTIEYVFKAISEPDHINNWWTLRCKGKPEIGEEYNFYFTPEYDWYGEVSKCDKNQSFYIRMTRADEDWTNTVFGFDLLNLEEGVRVEFWHKGWPSCNHHFRRSSWCWAMLLNGLKNYIEKGTIVPFHERE